jgi:hypothetical protein
MDAVETLICAATKQRPGTRASERDWPTLQGAGGRQVLGNGVELFVFRSRQADRMAHLLTSLQSGDDHEEAQPIRFC